MSQTCTLTGMILKAAPAGEYDKRLTILTLERGKVTAFARGARRPRSAMQAGTNLFCFGRFEAYEGRDSYTVVKVDIDNYFRELTLDLDLTYYGCYFLDLADYFTQYYDSAREQLKLLYQTLRALQVKSLDHRLVRAIYELKTLVYYGVCPDLFACTKCKKDSDIQTFSFKKRGVVCQGCHSKGEGEVALSAAALYTLQYIATSPVEKLYTFTVTDEVLQNICSVVGPYLHQYLDRPLKTAVFLEDL